MSDYKNPNGIRRPIPEDALSGREGYKFWARKAREYSDNGQYDSAIGAARVALASYNGDETSYEEAS